MAKPEYTPDPDSLDPVPLPSTERALQRRSLAALVVVAALGLSIQVGADVGTYDVHHKPDISLDNPFSWAATPLVNTVENTRSGN